jgi:hypothetical protein
MGQAYTWHAFIDRNFLKWEENSLVKVKKNGESLSFTTKIVNSGGHNESFTIENIPNWLQVSPHTGVVPPSSNMDVKFTVHDGLNPGIHEENLNLRSNFSNMLNLQIRVGDDKPDWTVNPKDYETSMSAVGMLKINNIISSNPDDMIAAFIGGVCVGVANPRYVASFDQWQVSLSIYSSTDNNPVEFRIWEAGSGRIYTPVLPTNVVFKANTVIGAPATPILFETSDGILTTVNLTNGWNWISFNVTSPALQTTNRLMQGITNGQEIKSQATFSRYERDVSKWSNETMGGEGLKTTQMYMILMTGNAALSLSGPAANPETTDINLVSGWNWISYIPQVNMTVAEALAGANPRPGDLVKNMTSFAVYDNVAGWVGSLEYMRPGLGYMYKANQASTFRYPKNSSLMATFSGGVSTYGDGVSAYGDGVSPTSFASSISAVSQVSVAFANVPIASRYESNLSLIAEVITSKPLSSSARLVAKSGNECRGIAEIQRFGEKHLFFIPLYSNVENDKISFILENGGEETVLNEKVTFKSHAVIGSLDKPFLLTDAEMSFNVYPNPFDNEINITFTVDRPTVLQIELLDLTGSVAFSQSHRVDMPGSHRYYINSRTTSKLPSGFYILRITQPDQEPVVFKLIKIK